MLELVIIQDFISKWLQKMVGLSRIAEDTMLYNQLL